MNDKSLESTMQRNDVLTCSLIPPDFNDDVQGLIYELLGYLPAEKYYLPHVEIIRLVLQRCNDGIINEDEFFNGADSIIKLIRNEEFDHDEFTCSLYSSDYYFWYSNYLIKFAEAAKSRITHFLGHEPDKDCSLLAELWMRELLSNNKLPLDKNITPYDIKAITLIGYREALLSGGITNANTSPLYGVILNQQFAQG